MLRSAVAAEDGETLPLRFLIVVLIFLTISFRASWAQVETDNPSLSTTSTTVGTQRLQWESNYFFVQPRQQLTFTGRVRFQGEDQEGSDQPFKSFPQLLRYGIDDNLELRLESETLAIQGPNSAFSDFSLGAKWNFFRNESWSLGLLGSITPPSGARPFRTERWSGGVSFLADAALSDNQTLTLNIGGGLVDDPSRSGHLFQTFGALCYDLDIDDRWGCYAEVAVQGPDIDSRIYETVIDIGADYHLSENSVINLALFRGLSLRGMDWGASIGFGLKL